MDAADRLANSPAFRLAQPHPRHTRARHRYLAEFCAEPAYLRYRFIRSFLRSPPRSASPCPRCSAVLGWRLSREASEGVESGMVLGARRGERGHDGSKRVETMMPQPWGPHLRHRRRACILRLTAEW